MDKKILIIGAGIAGLSAGCHARRNGYEVEIFEMGGRPGGLCTSWQRKDYIFDGCIRRLYGTNPDSQFNRLWREVGALDGQPVVNHDEFMRLEGGQGQTLIGYSNLERLEEELLRLAPADEAVIKELTGAAMAFTRFTVPLERPPELTRPWHWPGLLARMAPQLKYLGRFSRMSIREYSRFVQEPFVREALCRIMPAGYAMTELVGTLARLHNRDAGYPLGGSLEFARTIEKYYLSLGGKIRYGSAVKRILAEGGKAAGLHLAEGSKEYGDLIISAADLHTTLFDLLRGKYTPPQVARYFNQFPTHSSVQVSLGVDRDLSATPHTLSVKLPESAGIRDVEYDVLLFRHHAFDRTVSPAGKTAVTATLASSYDYWARIYARREKYQEVKERLAERVIATFQESFPGAGEKIEVTDVATPVTYNRYTNVWQGSYRAWVVPPREGLIRIAKTLPGLAHFYLAGQWTQPPAGLPGAMLSGRQVIQLICRQDKKSFREGPL